MTMFTNKNNVNILTSLLLQHGINTAVVCPGSRNAPIVHNFHEAGMRCVPVTDERSAGFYALGMSQASGKPVVVCVTSGTALLNLAPAVAEATYQHRGIIVVSADRPSEWIGQLDGQTLPQQNAFGEFVSMSVTLPEPATRDERWHCNRLVNEALLAVRRRGGKSVHINVPLAEPLFDFTVDKLPIERVIKQYLLRDISPAVLEEIAFRFFCSGRPMLVVGQCPPDEKMAAAIRLLSRRAVVLQEPLSPGIAPLPLDEALSDVGEQRGYMPDFLLYVGDTVVSKRLKKFLRAVPDAETWAVSEDGDVHDTFQNLTAVIEGRAEQIVSALASLAERYALAEESRAFHARWQSALNIASRRMECTDTGYSQAGAVQLFETMLGDAGYRFHVHYANSTSVRLGNSYSRHYIYVNRGINGIEGSLSTAAGFSAACNDRVFCVIGDLSFFYDSNALWNGNLRGNFRILLLNNGGGGIFQQLPGLEKSSVRDSMIAGGHHTSAKGLCEAYHIAYLSAGNMDELEKGMKAFMANEGQQPLLFEVLF